MSESSELDLGWYERFQHWSLSIILWIEQDPASAVLVFAIIMSPMMLVSAYSAWVMLNELTAKNKQQAALARGASPAAVAASAHSAAAGRSAAGASAGKHRARQGKKKHD
ncbi:hypothetical protein CAOG_010132 [Capsaspora owczarzaki ATCC 30864]|uniref:Uncharacterized protein n=1 Tax=Capsaspora owczarzaki (strain ATCC 30864) TaxID=595528 RepID=A0A0D2UR59_CAPO3|nr:hypothetical protein CAOG_010132 [Capsaspora owczarzaki ATCC 30864]